MPYISFLYRRFKNIDLSIDFTTLNKKLTATCEKEEIE